jgi:hypothetical protein
MKIAVDKKKRIPMPQSGYIVKESELESMRNDEQAKFLNNKGVQYYMAVVGI